MNATTQPKIRNLSTDTIRSLDKVNRPSQEELFGMIDAICRVKNWSRTFLCALLSFDAYELRRIELGQKEASGLLCRAVWFLYTMDRAPEQAFSLIHMATWGKVEARLPNAQRPLEGEARQQAIQQLRDEVARKYSPKRMTPAQIAERFNMSRSSAMRLAREAGYVFADARKATYRKKQVPLALRPESIWMHTDWRMKPDRIVETSGASIHQVLAMRTKFRKIGRNTPRILRRQIRACGANMDFFEPFLRWSKPEKIIPANPEIISCTES
jgi:hypothetical protein